MTGEHHPTVTHKTIQHCNREDFFMADTLNPGAMYHFQLTFTVNGGQPVLMGHDWKAGQADTVPAVRARAIEVAAQKLGIQPIRINVVSFRIAPK